MRFYLFFFFAGIVFQSQAQFSEGYYVIVGAFAIKKNAAKFHASLNKKGMEASLGYLQSRKIYYVYTLKNEDVSVCLKRMRELRQDSAFWDAWVRYINEAIADEDQEKHIESVPIAKVETPHPAIAPEKKDSVAEEPVTIIENEEIIQFDKTTLGNTEIFLSLYNATNDRVAQGKVQVIDAERGRLITEVPGNSYLILPDPKSKTGSLTLICDVLGYRKIQKEINFNNPLADSSFITQMGTSLVANFELVRYQKGDIRTLYNIYFYNDAAVMMPESKFELNSLLAMMKDNPTFNIVLHGHTNGHYHGKIIRVGPSGDFFSVTKDAKTSIGSAKELSESRAEVIKDWLVANGVDGSRVTVKAWGGKRPLYDKNGQNAKKNIRVEVEVVQD